MYSQNLTANANAGFAVNNPTVPVSFPTDDSVASQLERLTAASITLQNLRGIGVGCPIESTTFVAQTQALLGETPEPPVASSTEAATSTAVASTSAAEASPTASDPAAPTPTSTDVATPTDPTTPANEDDDEE